MLAIAGNAKDVCLMPGSRRCPGAGNGNPLQCPCLESLMDSGAWRATVRGSQRDVHHLATEQQQKTLLTI